MFHLFLDNIIFSWRGLQCIIMSFLPLCPRPTLAQEMERYIWNSRISSQGVRNIKYAVYWHQQVEIHRVSQLVAIYAPNLSQRADMVNRLEAIGTGSLVLTFCHIQPYFLHNLPYFQQKRFARYWHLRYRLSSEWSHHLDDGWRWWR